MTLCKGVCMFGLWDADWQSPDAFMRQHLLGPTLAGCKVKPAHIDSSMAGRAGQHSNQGPSGGRSKLADSQPWASQTTCKGMTTCRHACAGPSIGLLAQVQPQMQDLSEQLCRRC